MSIACKHLPVTCFQTLRQKSIREDVGFQGLPGSTNHTLPAASVTRLCSASESSAGNQATEPSFSWQRAVQLWKSDLYSTAEALANRALRGDSCEQGHRAVGYLSLTPTLTDSSWPCPGCPLWAPEAAAELSLTYSRTEFQIHSFPHVGVSGKEMITFARVEMGKPVFLQNLYTQESGGFF